MSSTPAEIDGRIHLWRNISIGLWLLFVIGGAFNFIWFGGPQPEDYHTQQDLGNALIWKILWSLLFLSILTTVAWLSAQWQKDFG